MNILKEKDLYYFLQNLNMKTDLKEVLTLLSEFLAKDNGSVWVLLFNPLLKTYSQNCDKKQIAKINKLIIDYLENGIEQEDIIEFLRSISGKNLILEPIIFGGQLQGVLGVIGQEEMFVKFVLECVSQKLENFWLKEENIRTLNERMEFLASVSHEFKTPLNSIIGFSDIIQRKNTNPKMTKYINNISNSSKFLLGFISDILDVSRIKTSKIELNREYFSPQKIILKILDSLEMQIKSKNIDVNYTLMEGLIYADSHRFHQLILNLVTNAVKFNKLNGKIVIIAYNNPNGDFFFEIKDTGDGISKKDYGKIFKFFSQVNSDSLKRQKGSGIGLFLCKAIVDAHKGTIEFKSRLNYGTTFRIILPKNIE